jgi:methylated-DNA-[protein]-cysteine S-methyltransferase
MAQSACISHTDLGWIGLLAGDQGLRAVSLPRPTMEEAVHDLRLIAGTSGLPAHASYPASGLQANLLNETMQRLKRYARGEVVEFTDLAVCFDLRDGTPWQQSVWRALLDIPYGQTRSYGWVAQHLQAPKAARAVGMAVGANPLPIILPCHRVVGSRGELTGYTGGGIAMKRRLLDLESAHQLALL